MNVLWAMTTVTFEHSALILRVASRVLAEQASRETASHVLVSILNFRMNLKAVSGVSFVHFLLYFMSTIAAPPCSSNFQLVIESIDTCPQIPVSLYSLTYALKYRKL